MIRPLRPSAQVLVEFILCLGIFFFTFLALLQLIALINAKLYLNLAAFHAARMYATVYEEDYAGQVAAKTWPPLNNPRAKLEIDCEGAESPVFGQKVTVTLTGHYPLPGSAFLQTLFGNDSEAGMVKMKSVAIFSTEGND